MRWFITLLLGAAGGYLAARATTRAELDQFQRDFLARERASEPKAQAPAPAAPEAPAAARAQETETAEAPPLEAPGIDPTVVMLIAASVAAYLGKHAVVRRIKVAGHRGGDPWALSGRATLLASHNVVQSHAHTTR